MLAILTLVMLVVPSYATVSTTEDCCRVSLDVYTAGYWNETTTFCYTNSTQTADGVESDSALCQNSLNSLDEVGTDVGGFLTNLAPGVGSFVIILAVFGGVGLIVASIVYVVKNKINK